MWVVLDQTWIDFYNGNIDDAQMAAEANADAAITLLNASGFKTVFNVTFSRTFSSPVIAPPYGGQKEDWCNDIRAFYNNRYPCLANDVILLYTRVLGNSHYAFNRVALMSSGNSFETAHEIGHALNLTHLQTGPMGSPTQFCCTSNKTMMCIPFPNMPTVTPVNAACGINGAWLNSNVFTTSFCNQTKYATSIIPDDFECPPVSNVGYSIVADNPNPVIGCKSGGEIVTISATLINNNSTTLRNIRASISNEDSDNIEFVDDPLLDFNCLTILSNRIEFRITNPVNSNCDDQYFSLGPGESKTVKVKVKYLGGAFTGVGGDDRFDVNFYTGTNPVPDPTSNAKIFTIIPFVSIGPGNYNSMVLGNWDNNSPLFVLGTILMNNTTPYDFGSQNKKILFKPGAALEIANGSIVNMTHAVAEGCSTMWKGITVRQGGTLNMSKMTTVKDAQIAVNVQKGGTANIQSCKFEDNNFAISTDNLGTGNHNLTLLGNTFQTSDAGLKPAWGIGQSPAPGTKGFAGIYVKDLAGGLSIDKDATFELANQFTNLQYGIFAENTDVTVRDAMFSDITKETRAAGYPGPLFTGTAVHSNFGKVDVKGSFTGIAPKPVLMNNCYNGVQVLGGAIDVAGFEMGNMTNGIVAGGGTNKAYNIYWNNIAASERGISIYYQSGLPGHSSIDNNIVHMIGNPNGVGIANGGQEMFPQQEGFVVNNHVTVEEGATGIQIGVANRIKVTQNNVNLSGSSTHFGIKVEGGDRNLLNCNTVTSAGGANDGIYAVHASRASVLCNLTNGTSRGLHFEGMLSGKNKADIGGNRMESNAVAGLLMGTDAVVGGQVHRGNKFEGTEALAGIEADFNSKFTVDAAENPDFLPDTWLPINWFINVANPSPSFDCGANTTCPPTPLLTPDYPLDIKIVKGELGGTLYQAANKWLSQRRFYELVLEEGNPYPGNSDVSTFLSQAQTSGLSAYANVQTGIRQLGAMSEGSRATAATSLLTLNAALTGSANYQVNEKLVNQIFLQTIAIGSLDFSETQIALLEGIAALCPLSDGEAVLRSRALLQLLQGAPADYDDLSICGGGERSSRKQMTGQSSIRVYPNPANDVLSIDFQGIGEISGQFLMFNALGQIIKEIALHSNDGTTQLPLHGFSDGVYWYVVPGLGAGKILIQH